MLGFNEQTNVELRAKARGVARLGTICGALAMVVMITGCPGTTPTPTACTADTAAEVCNDNLNCTTDACTDDVCVNTAVACDEGQTCDETTGVCGGPCTDDAGCDDGDACTDDVCTDGVCGNAATSCDDNDACTDDTCDSATGCANTAISCDDGDACTDDSCDAATGCANDDAVCDAGFACDAATGDCVATCDVDADCDDTNACTDDVCTDGQCVSTDKACDNGDFCDGTESCDAATGDCVSSGTPCGAGEVCDEDADACNVGTACTTDADCDEDGDFCTGTASCNTTDGVCENSGDPCTATQTCNEDLNKCDDPAGETIGFTLGVDNLTGTGGIDTFQGLLAFNAPTGTTLPTFGNADSANGGDGVDSAIIQTNFTGGTTVAATLTSIETLNVTDFGTAATTLNGVNFTGVTEINSVGSSNGNALIVSNLPTFVPTVGLTNTNAGMDIRFATAGSSGAADNMVLNVDGVTAGTFTITSATSNGAEQLTINSNGAAANTLAAVAQAGGGTTLATMNLAGDQDLTITAALPTTVLTANAGGGPANGAFNLTFGAAVNAVTGGNGDDTFKFGANYTTGDVVDGGAGTNTLGLNTAQAAPATNQTNLTNIQGLMIQDAHTTTTVASRFGSVATVSLPLGSNGGTVTLADGAAVTVGARGANNDSAGALTVTMNPNTSADDLTLTMNDSDTTGAVNVPTVNRVALVSNVDLDGSAADGGVNTFAAFTLPDLTGSQLNISGNEAVSFSGVVTSRSINATGFGHNLTMTINTTGATTTSTVATGGASITGGTAIDILVGSTAGDSLDCSSGGNDVAQPGRGIDTVSFGTGICTLDLEDLATAQAVSANRVTVTGFQADGTVFNATTGTVDAIRFDNLGTNGDLSDGASAAEMQIITTPANVTVGAAVSLVELSFEFSSGALLGAGGTTELNGTTLLSACGATTGTTACTFTTNANDEDIIIIAYQSGNAYIYAGNGAGGNAALVAGEINLIATISGGVSVGGFVVSQFIN